MRAFTRSILLLSLTLTPLSASADVILRVVDRDATPDTPADVTFDAQQGIIVAYAQLTEPGIRLARLAGSVVDRYCVSETGSPPASLSMAIDPFGLISVVHNASGDGLPAGLRFSVRAGDWGSNTVHIPVTEAGREAAYAIDSVGRPYVAFLRNSGPLALATFDVSSGGWRAEDVPAPRPRSGIGSVLSITVNHQDRPVIAYCDETSSLTVASRQEIGWSYRKWYTPGGLTPNSGLAVVCDSVDAPVVVCALPHELRLVRFNLLNVTEQAIAVGLHPIIGPNSMATDSSDHLTVAFCNGITHTMNVAQNHLGWSVLSFDTVDVETRAAVAVDGDGRWVAAYIDERERQLKVAGTSLQLSPAADLDCDRDVDADDVSAFELCGTGPDVPYDPQDLPDGCHFASNNEGSIAPDFDRDGDVDQLDFARIQRCAGQAGVSPDPGCEE